MKVDFDFPSIMFGTDPSVAKDGQSGATQHIMSVHCFNGRLGYDSTCRNAAIAFCRFMRNDWCPSIQRIVNAGTNCLSGAIKPYSVFRGNDLHLSTLFCPGLQG